MNLINLALAAQDSPLVPIFHKEYELGLLRMLLRIYSWIFEALLCLLGIGVAIVSLTVGRTDPVHIDWLPWSAGMLPVWLIGLGFLGLILVFLAMVGRYRFLLFLFAAAVFALLAKGLFFTANSFDGPSGGRNSALLVLGAFLAIIGAWPSNSKARNYRSH
jgi:hypothetical protein